MLISSELYLAEFDFRIYLEIFMATHSCYKSHTHTRVLD